MLIAINWYNHWRLPQLPILAIWVIRNLFPIEQLYSCEWYYLETMNHFDKKNI